MLMPTGMTSSERKKYIEENSYTISKESIAAVRANKHPGLRPVKVKEAKSVSPSRKTYTPKTSSR